MTTLFQESKIQNPIFEKNWDILNFPLPDTILHKEDIYANIRYGINLDSANEKEKFKPYFPFRRGSADKKLLNSVK